MIGRDIEVRTIHGGCYRGRLIGIVNGWLELERHTGHELLIAQNSVTAVLNEQRLPSASGALVSREVREP